MDDGIAVALLAAGSGRRFGGEKLDQDLGGRPVGCWAAALAESLGFSRRVVVTPPAQPAFVGHLTGWERVVNSDHETGLASSIRAAATAASGAHRLVIMLADMPFVERANIDELALSEGVAFTLYPDGNRGVPSAFPADLLPTLATLPDGENLSRKDWQTDVTVIEPASQRALWDIDTLDDLITARASL